MSEKIDIPDQARAELRGYEVPDSAIGVAECLLTHVIETAATIAREYDEEAGDDPNLAGFTCARRAKNLAAKEMRDSDAEDLADVNVSSAPGFSWNIDAAGTRMHIYSAPTGLDAFLLAGGQRKADIVVRSMEQLKLFDASGSAGQPGDLVMAYRRSGGGVMQAWLGVMKSPSEFAWDVQIYDADLAAGELEKHQNVRSGPSFREQPEPEADISLRSAPRKQQRENL